MRAERRAEAPEPGAPTPGTEPGVPGSDAPDQGGPAAGPATTGPPAPDGPAARADRARRIAAASATVLAVLLVYLALAVPLRGGVPAAAELVRLPVEALIAAALVLVLPARARVPVAVAAGVLLGVLTVLRLLDAGFREVLARGFDPVSDWVLLADAYRFLAGTQGSATAVGAAVGAGLLAAAVPLALALAGSRLARVLPRHRPAATRTLAVLVPAWVGCAALGVQLAPPVQVAAADAAEYAVAAARHVPAGLRDLREFRAAAADDAYAANPELLGALRGKDVVIVFVESYGRSAVTDPAYAPRVGPVLDAGTARLAAAGFGARSGWLTSPIAGGSSWLAHATFLSGLRVDSPRRYRALVEGGRFTLPRAFTRAGWDTVAVMPGTTELWPEAAFYGYDRVHDVFGLGYRGPDLGWATVPDQFTLAAFERLERDRTDRPPLMAEIALVSSHAPWALVPPVLPWDAVGDGSVYRGLAPSGDPAAIWARGTDEVRAAYGGAVAYSLASVVAYVETHGDDDLVLVVLGDHQPAPLLAGPDAGFDVPVSVVSRDPAVLDRIAGWGWTPALRPDPAAPVWPMEAFRDRFLAAFAS